MNLFIDWNPIYDDDFKAGDSFAATGANKPWVPEDDETANPWAKLIDTNKKI